MWVMRLWERAYNTFINPRRGAADHNLQCDFTAAIWGQLVKSVENSKEKKSLIPYRSRCYFLFPGNKYCRFQLNRALVNMPGSVYFFPCVNWYLGTAISKVFCLYSDGNLQADKCLWSHCPVSLPLEICNSSVSLPVVAIQWSMRQFSSDPPWRIYFIYNCTQRASATQVACTDPCISSASVVIFVFTQCFSCLEPSIENIEALRKMIQFVLSQLLLLCRPHRFGSRPGFHFSLCQTEFTVLKM